MRKAILICAVALLLLPFAVFAVEQQDKDAILKEINSFIDKNPDILRSVVFSMCDEYLRENKIDEAISVCEKALKILPDSEDLLNRAGSLYNQKGDFAKAAEVYKKMTQIRPDNIWYFQMLSNTYRNAGEKDKAASVWENLMQKSPKADTFMQAANFYSSEDNMEKAIAAVKKAVELDPDNTGYLQSLESFYLRKEEFDEAEVICNKILASTKDQWLKDWANTEIINIYQRQNKLSELVSKFENDLAQSPKDISQYRKLVDLYQRSNETDKAIQVYEKAVVAGLDDRDVNNRLLDLYEMANKFDKAEAQIKKIIGMAPNENYLYERLANLLNRAGKQGDAKKAWEQFLSKVPNDAGAFSRFGDRLNEWGDSDGAIAQYKKAQSLDANNLWYTMRIADILIAKGKVEEAKKELNNIIAKTTDDWMKQEAERRISGIEAGAKEAATFTPAPVVEPTVTTPAKEPVVEQVPVAIEKTEVKPTAESKPTPAAPVEKKKRGWFSR